MKIINILLSLQFILIKSIFYKTKIFYTPILNKFFPRLHPIILFKKIEKEENTYIVDFTPEKDIDLKDFIKILFGNNIPGKIRMVYFEKINKDNILEIWYEETKKSDINKILENLNDENINKIINKYNKSFNLYNNNCYNFKNYFLKNLT